MTQNKKKTFSHNKTARPAENPYENRTGGQTIITKKPAWDNTPAVQTSKGTPSASSGNQSNTNNKKNKKRFDNRNQLQNKNNHSAQKNKGTNTNAKQAPKNEPPQKSVTLPNEKGVYNFAEAELAEDTAIKVVSRKTPETKYANFEEFLKNQ